MCLEIDIDADIDQTCLSMSYLKRCPQMQLIMCSRRPIEKVREFVRQIEESPKNFEKTKFENIMTARDFFDELS